MTEKDGHDNVEIDTTETAIVVRIQGQAGQRVIDMSFGVPLAMNLLDLNKYVDKVTSVIDRQIAIGDLRQARANLAGAEKTLRTTREQMAHFEQSCMKQWESQGKRGQWQPYGNQKQQLENWEKNIAEFRENRIPQFQADIQRLEALVRLEE